MKRLSLFAALSVAAVAGIMAYHFARPALEKNALASLLHAAGFPAATIAQSETIPGGIAFSGITLDPYKPLTTLQAATLQQTADGKILSLHKLGGAQVFFNPALIPALRAAMRKNNIASLQVNAAEALVDVPLFGVVKLLAKGRIDLANDGRLHLAATMWSDQSSIKAQASLNGNFMEQGASSLDLQVSEGRIDLPLAAASRVSGWLNLNQKSTGAPWTLGGQFLAGAGMFFNTPMHATTLSLESKRDGIGANIDSRGMDSGTALSADALLGAAAGDHIKVTMNIGNLSMMLARLLSALPDSVPDHPGGPTAVLTYRAEGKDFTSLADHGTVAVAAPGGAPWLQAGLDRTGQGADLDVQQARLEPLATMLGIHNLTCEGNITGLLSLSANGKGGVIVQDGMLQNTDTGVLALDIKDLPATFTSKNTNIAGMLKSFAYQKMEITVNSAEIGLDADLSISGHPLLNFGQKPADLTLHFEGEI